MHWTAIDFKTVYPNFEDFTAGIKAVKYAKFSIDEKDNYLYNILFNYFCNQNIAYDTIDAFNRYFIFDYINNREKFIQSFQILEKLHNLKTTDLNVVATTINNYSNNSNNEIAEPLEQLATFLSSQNSGITRENDFTAYARAVEKLKDNYLQYFVNLFTKHFNFIL